MVEFIDNSIKAQLSIPTMEIPIQFAFTYPDRLKSNSTSFDFTKSNTFSFEEVDLEKFRCIQLAYQAGRLGGTYTTVLNVSNDIAVDMFLKDLITFNQIESIIEDSLNQHKNINNPNLDDIINAISSTEEYINKKELTR